MTFMLWQIMDMKSPLSDNIRQAMEYHTKKYGLPPNILEYSKQLSDVPNVDGVEFVQVNIPKNILLIGVKHETEKVCISLEE